MLPVSGAWQLIASGATTGDHPEILGDCGVLQVGDTGEVMQEEVPQTSTPRVLLELLHDRRVGVHPELVELLAPHRFGGKTRLRMQTHIRSQISSACDESAKSMSPASVPVGS